MKSRGEKLPKGRSYPLKPSELEKAIREARIETPVEFTRWDRFDALLQGSFYPAGSVYDREDDYIWIHCRAVPSALARDANAYLMSVAVPKLVAWAREIECLDMKSPIRREKQTLNFPLGKFG